MGRTGLYPAIQDRQGMNPMQLPTQVAPSTATQQGQQLVQTFQNFNRKMN
jgi:hypothetical protein